MRCVCLDWEYIQILMVYGYNSGLSIGHAELSSNTIEKEGLLA